MKRLLLAALLLGLGAFDASAQRVTLEVPLSPVPGQTVVVPAGPALSGPAPLALTAFLSSPAMAPVAKAPVITGATPANLTPLVTARPAVPVLPRNLIYAPVAASKGDDKVHAMIVDSLRKHGAESGGLSSLQGETGKSALEANFLSAASLRDDGAVPPLAQEPAPRPLLDRMLERVTLDDRDRPDEKKALEASFKRLLETPTGRHYAEEFLAEGLKATVRFDDFPDSQLFLVDNRKKFYAAQAFTDFTPEGNIVVRLNRHYVDGDPEYMHESLPSIIGHELLGHGLWYGRADKAGLKIAFHYHELNETMARLVGWAIDHELDGKFEDAGAWNYANDPVHYLQNQKMRQPYYAVTFSEKEMSDPLATLLARLTPAENEIARSERNLTAQKTWTPVIDHFIEQHGIPAKRFELLKKEMADQEAYHAAEIANSHEVLKDIKTLLANMTAEADRGSETYLRNSSSNPLFARLRQDSERLGEIVRALASSGPYVPPRPPAPRPAGQISWDEFIKMYQDDVAADAHRSVKHWR